MYSVDNYNFSGKKVLIRVDFNVPLDSEGNITDDTRIVTALPTIRKILADNGAVIIMTHLGRPKGKFDASMSTKLILPRLQEVFGQPVKFASDCIGSEAEAVAASLKMGEIMLLENLRFHKEETEGDEAFAEKLARLGDVYVMNAFGTAHRAHASTCTIAKFFPYDKMFGYLIENEIRNIDKVLKKAERPFTAILGGSKVSTKIQIIEALLEKVDNLVIGGGLTYTFSKAMGGKVGDSLIEDDFLEVAKRVIEKAKRNNVKLFLPEDCLIANSFSNDAEIRHCEITDIPDGWQGMGIGIKTTETYTKVIENSATILWNGPMGVFEFPHFAMGTLRVALSVARATDKGAYSLVGGGDSIAALNKFSLAHKISYISTAGGALLEYIEGKKLPSIQAIHESFSVDDYDFKGKRTLMRVDFNVPIDDKGKITDETRIVTAVPTIRKILADGGSVILLSHMGRPKGKVDMKFSNKLILGRLKEIFAQEIKFAPDCIGDEAVSLSSSLKPGEILLLENLRFYKEETDCDDAFAKKLASLGDAYVMNAFGTAHRAHASTYSIARHFPNDRMLGYLVESEIKNIDRVLNKAQKPFTAILGGSKVSTKIHIIEALLEKVDNLIIGGGLTYTFSKALGGKVGNSLIEDDYLDVALRVIKKAKEKNVNLYLPEDCIIADSFSNEARIDHCEIDSIPDGWEGMGIGIKTTEIYTKVIENSATLLWNGPMGVFEFPHFAMGTLRVALSVARATDKGAYSLVGGGDSIAALNKFSLGHKISYISTAGGALLEYIEGKELPSLKAIKGKFD